MGQRPAGLELWAEFAPGVEAEEADARYKGVAAATGALMCASAAALAEHGGAASPELTLGGVGGRDARGEVRYGQLPHEAVCVENLTPWLRLLPCRDHRGLAALLAGEAGRAAVFRAHYHSLGLELTQDPDGGATLVQTLQMVLPPREGARGGGWSLHEVLPGRLEGRCEVAAHSHVYVELEGSLLRAGLNGSRGAGVDADAAVENGAYAVMPSPSAVLEDARGGAHGAAPDRILLDYPVPHEYRRDGQAAAMDVTFAPRGGLAGNDGAWAPPAGPPMRASLTARRGRASPFGDSTLEIRMYRATQRPASLPPPAGAVDGSEREAATTKALLAPVPYCLLQVVPSWARVLVHTLRARVDGRDLSWREAFPSHSVRAATSSHPATLELCGALPAGASAVEVRVEVEAALGHVDEYLPDAARGRDLPAAVLTLTAPPANRSSGNGAAGWRVASALPASDTHKRPLLRRLHATGRAERVYSDALLLDQPQPDFSMPYNVILATGTLQSMLIGSIMALLLRRPGDQPGTNGSSGGLLRRLLSRFTGFSKEKAE